MSSKLSGAQLNYNILEKEAFAVLFCLSKIEHLVYGSKIILHVDNNPLHYILNARPSSSRLTRWAISLSRYDLDVVHLSGKLNIVADAMSRL